MTREGLGLTDSKYVLSQRVLPSQNYGSAWWNRYVSATLAEPTEPITKLLSPTMIYAACLLSSNSVMTPTQRNLPIARAISTFEWGNCFKTAPWSLNAKNAARPQQAAADSWNHYSAQNTGETGISKPQFLLLSASCPSAYSVLLYLWKFKHWGTHRGFLINTSLFKTSA